MIVLGNVWRVDQQTLSSSTRGLVGDTSFIILPEITPLHCFLLTILTLIVSFLFFFFFFLFFFFFFEKFKITNSLLLYLFGKNQLLKILLVQLLFAHTAHFSLDGMFMKKLF